MNGLCECGCGEATNVPKYTNTRNGHVRGVPYRFVLGHSGRVRMGSNLNRYTIDASGCWVWPIVGKNNYPTPIKWRGTRTSPYRAMWQETFNLRIPADLQLDHLCRNPHCVNPDHLEVVTPKENQRRRPCCVDRLVVEQIRGAVGAPAQVAREFGVALSLVHQIRKGERWQPDTQAHRAEYLNAIAERVRANA